MWMLCDEGALLFLSVCVCACARACRCACWCVGKCMNWILQKSLIVFYSLHHGAITVNSWWVKDKGCFSVFICTFPFLVSELHQDMRERYKERKWRNQRMFFFCRLEYSDLMLVNCLLLFFYYYQHTIFPFNPINLLWHNWYCNMRCINMIAW